MKIPVIEFVDFTFQYHAQSRPTLDRINLTIYEGEKVLIVGPSGSGKSTLAHCMNGLIPFFYTGEMSGSMKIKGKELKDQSIAELSDTVGTVLQDPDGQFVGLTVAEDIVFKLENDAIPQAEMTDRLAAAARKVDIEQYLESSPHALSGGQKQKTTLGGVLVNDVDILLFDEPLASLDPYTGKRTIELIDRIHLETGKTVVIIEHRLEDVLHRSVDRIIVVRDGQAQADLPAAELLSSNILVEAGIREPLYITALKYAGCSITPEIHPEHVDTIRLDSCTPRLQEWYRSLNNSSETADFPVILELKDISFGYEKNQPILHHVSLRIGKGEIVSIAGRNGAGKSTISKLICGFYRPSSGTILLNGRDIRSDSIKERADRIGFVMQNPNHMLSKTLIYDEVALGLKLRGVPEEAIRERVHEVLKVCGLYAFRSWPVSALSYGQKKRVTIASILVLSPEVIILDEPTAGQDYRHYNDMMEFLLTLNRQGITIIMITHDMHLMLEYAQRTIVLSEGTKIADDSPVHVLTNPGVVEAAHLKMTSVHELAIRAGVDRPEEFVSRFIAYDRGMRGQ
ncbi:putative HMP/thiamine import ATP-binding protein YkoD [compost metagenome]